MSNNATIQILLRTVDLATRPFESVQAASKSLSESFQKAQHSLRELNSQVSRLEAFRKTKARLTDTVQGLKQSCQNLKALAVQFKNAELPFLVNSQQKFSAIRQRFQSGKALADKATAAGSASMGFAASGFSAGQKLLKPGYDLSLKSSELQAILGLDKQSPEMAALRKQARQPGDSMSASPDDIATAQIIVAKSGADTQGVLAQTPAILNLSQANDTKPEDTARLLIDTRTAFGLATDSANQIADVLSVTMNKTHATLDELSNALTTVAPVAVNAGVSLEEAAAMSGLLHDEKITGSAAGKESSAVITHLQSPTLQANTAINALGVNTKDSQGNTLPVIALLKQIAQSFEHNKLSADQRTEYTHAIFGKEASPAASVLMNAAASGKLDQLTTDAQASNGKTRELATAKQNNLSGDFSALQSAWIAVSTDLFDQQESSLRKLTQTATSYVVKLDGWIQKNNQLVQTLGIIAAAAVGIAALVGAIGYVAGPVILGINTLIAVASTLGTVFTMVGSGIITVLGALTWPVIGVVAAIVAGALLIRKYWEPISAFFGGVVEGLSAAFAPVSELFTPLKPVFDWLGEILQTAWQWFKNLIAPVNATQDTLNSCRDAGVMFGQALADSLLLPLNIFNKLRSGIDWVLEKLGIINKQSSTLDQTAEKTSAATQSNTWAPATSSYGGYQAYQPVTASAGRSYVDQSKNDYHITLQGGTAPGMPLDSQLQDALEKYERDKRARARSNMMYDG